MTSAEPPATRILIVDDEPYNLDLLQQELEDRGYEVELAGDGQEALDAVAAHRPDLILLDVLMPKLDGIETCRILKDDPDTALIPVIIMTALSAVEDRIEGIRAGADDFLSKPVDDRELMARIDTALRTKLAVDRTRHELESAARQLEAVGRVDRDTSVVVMSAEDEDLDAIRAVLSDAGGQEIEGSERVHHWMFLDPDPGVHVRRGARAALAVNNMSKAAVALESGSALVSPHRVEDGRGTRWETSAGGPAVDTATAIVRLAPPGHAVVGPEAARRLEGLVDMEPLSGSDVKLMSGEVDVADDQTESPTLPWPDGYGSVLEPLREAWNVTGPIYLARSLSGKSGARVYLVDITTDGFSGQAILKLDEALQKDGDDDEARRHLRALQTNPAYSENHLPRVVYALVHDGKAATLSSIAGGGLEYVLPWAQVDFERQVEAAAGISLGILRDWNTGYELSDLLMPHELLVSWLDYRLDPEEGRISRFLEGLDVDPVAATFLYEGQWYPNPYAFSRGELPLPSRTALRAARGCIHGDLHGFNVLMPAPAETDTYYIIDLAFYEEDAFLLYDNAYFELTHLLHTRETVAARRWLELLDSAQGGTVPTSDDYGLLRTIEAVRSGVRQWIDQAEPNRLAYIESQYALARVATGLNFVHKRVSEQLKLLALTYAAANLKSYLKFQAIEWPRAGPVLGG